MGRRRVATRTRALSLGRRVDPAKCKYSQLGLRRTTPVGIFWRGGEPLRLLEMSGNVLEWTRANLQGTRTNPNDGRESAAGRTLAWCVVARSSTSRRRACAVPAGYDPGYRLSTSVFAFCPPAFDPLDSGSALNSVCSGRLCFSGQGVWGSAASPRWKGRRQAPGGETSPALFLGRRFVSLEVPGTRSAQSCAALPGQADLGSRRVRGGGGGGGGGGGLRMEVAAPVPGTSAETTCPPGVCAGDVACDFCRARRDGIHPPVDRQAGIWSTTSRQHPARDSCRDVGQTSRSSSRRRTSPQHPAALPDPCLLALLHHQHLLCQVDRVHLQAGQLGAEADGCQLGCLGVKWHSRRPRVGCAPQWRARRESPAAYPRTGRQSARNRAQEHRAGRC